MAEEKEKAKKEAKKAELSYKILRSIKKDSEELWLVEVNLKTGRHHQIRVQFAHFGCPLWGDNKYNPQIDIQVQKDLGLFAIIFLLSLYIKFLLISCPLLSDLFQNTSSKGFRVVCLSVGI